MSIRPEGSMDRAEQLSALADGELEPAAVAGLCAQWRDDSQARSRWHDYQLIGDVLRSEDLASPGLHDLDFLRRLRVRLDAEPVVLAPQPLVGALRPAAAGAGARRQPWRHWRAGAAIAAGCMVVAVAAVNLVRPLPSELEASATAAAVKGPGAAAPTRDPAAAEATALVAHGSLIRDARIDHYLAAHRQLSGGSLLGGHAAFLRQATAAAPQR